MKRNNSSLLINESPLQVLPSLATTVGLAEAIVLQQVHYWLTVSNNVVEGKKWVYNTYESWQNDNFPFWSVSTIKRTITSLEHKKLLVSRDDLNKFKPDRTKWYTIDYEQLKSLENTHEVNLTSCSGHNNLALGANCTYAGEVIMPPAIPETTENTPKTTAERRLDPGPKDRTLELELRRNALSLQFMQRERRLN